jgi:hypothetical protein
MTGTGLGSFHAELANANGWLLQQGLPAYPDWPSSAYLTLIADLGIAGWFLLLGGFIIYFSNIFLVIREKTKNHLRLPILAAVTALLLSFVIGIHIPNRSAAALSFGLFAGLFSITSPSTKRVSKWLVLVAALFLIGSIFHKAISAPTQVAFRWRETGSPQTVFYFREKLNGTEGIWKPARGELIVETQQIKILTKNPEEKLPATLKAELVSSSNETLDSFVFDISTAQFSPIKIEIPANRCNLKPTITEHCIIRYELSPSWIYGNYEMGIFLLD